MRLRYVILTIILIVLGSMVWRYLQTPQDEIPATAPTPPIKVETRADAVRCLALNIYWEATVANEPEEGQRMVAYVTHQRANLDRSYWGGNTICGVVYARRSNAVRPSKRRPKGGTHTVCQFHWTCLPVKEQEPKLVAKYAVAEQFAVDELDGKYAPPEILKTATSYLNPQASKPKNRAEFAKRLVCLGTVEGSRHVFHRDATVAERARPEAERVCTKAA